jgi:hypothetical protein
VQARNKTGFGNESIIYRENAFRLFIYCLPEIIARVKNIHNTLSLPLRRLLVMMEMSSMIIGILFSSVDSVSSI